MTNTASEGYNKCWDGVFPFGEEDESFFASVKAIAILLDRNIVVLYGGWSVCSSMCVVTEWPRGGLCQVGFMISQLQTHPCLPCHVMMELDSADYIYSLPAGLVLGSAEKTIEGLEVRKSRKGCLSFCALLPMGHWEGGCEMDTGRHTTAERALPFSEDTS